ncbi:MAG TPA: peptidyl-prolyl cis-trans isomerase [Solirubrobacterales bacterium]|nr:peptidyl-prolyl cis-trans isomerase [Solirubrobacterales bacterium]
MSPDQGRRRTAGKGGNGGGAGPVAARRLGLIVFGLAFVVLFAIVAIADGVGDPSIPSGDVVMVTDVPGSVGEITEDQFKHGLELAAVQGGAKKAPKPGDAKYDELKETTLKSMLESIWLQGLANEWGIEVTDKEVAAELKKVKKESFKTEAEFQKFLKESHYTPADINERVKLQILSKQLQEQLKAKVPAPSQSEVEDYYEAAKNTQFTQKPSRDIRLVSNKDRKKAEEAFAALSKDNTAKNWEKVAKKYSEAPSKEGGLQKGVPEGALEEPLNAAIFNTPEGQVEGPIKAKGAYTVFQVENSTPESVQELKAVEAQIQSTMAQRNEQEYFTNYVTGFNIEWTGRTFCAPGYVISRCANYKSNGHPTTAPAACFEADPKGGLPEACPAPVSQLVPALPGTVTPLEPKGKPLAQRPRPKEEAGAAAESATELPEGAVPPPAEAPSE